MATKLNLLLSFATGQGVAGGLSNYVNYPQDHDSNYSSIQSTVNQLIDEVNVARVNNAQIPTDNLVPSVVQDGRMSITDAKITYSAGGTSITVADGRIFVNGKRIDVTGDTLTGFNSATTRYIAVDETGLLYVETAAAQRFFDIATVNQAGTTLSAGEVVDNLGFNELSPLHSADTTNRIVERRTGTNVLTGLSHPSIRNMSADGTLEDAGFAHPGVENRIAWMSERDVGPGSGNPVTGAHLTERGQFALLEQARVQAERTTNQAIATGAAFDAITWDTPAANSAGQHTWRREPSGYFSDPFIAASGDVLTVPSHATLNGTYLWTAMLRFNTSSATAVFVEARLRLTAGGFNIAAVRVPAEDTETVITLSGMMDLQQGDTIELQVRHGDPGSVNVTSARVSGFLIGGPV